MADQSVVDYVKAQYPAFAGLMSIPDIADLMTMAQAQNWTSTQLQAALYDTQWWKSTPETGRTWQIKKLTDPASASQQTLNTGNQIAALAQGWVSTSPCRRLRGCPRSRISSRGTRRR